MFIFKHFTVYAYRTLDSFVKKKPLNFYFKTRKYFRDEITRLVINTRLITTLKNVDMFKIIEFYWIMHSVFCGWKHFKIFITRSLEDGLVGSDFQNGGKSTFEAFICHVGGVEGSVHIHE